ncbi:hypothetical protein GF359_09610 [candidate division WOR-3 bacterium]|uniref:Uncharacterized protein n=1 Tax=candidate division WOR-3 bacterium TaxID=2052148 RepID=A0A9D5KCC4_UNCW3|nr:hypothetical protein [candidate division WOR-3 bacterium]MBD3365455.1 hypothetical protein [candidate division WOR-3 bacterium]
MTRSDGYIKRTFLILLVTAFVLNASTVSVEAYYSEELTEIPESRQTETAVQLTFSIDTSCLVQFSANGRCLVHPGWLELDRDSMPALLEVRAGTGPVPIVYTYCLHPGEHTLAYMMRGDFTTDTTSTSPCGECCIQARIILPDAATDADAESAPSLSRESYVTSPGATQVADSSGRALEGVLNEDRISISALPQGTYYAKKEDRTVVKIVKGR